MVAERHRTGTVPADAERLRRLNDLLGLVVEHSPFQRARLDGLVPLERIEDLARLPLTTKDLSARALHPPAPDERHDRRDAARA
jgi:phenylacetate-coenzyme A ligase PaaK-like adenylate-forming protein